MEEGMSQAHLSDLFRTGKLITLKVPAMDNSELMDIEVWVRKPHPTQQDKAMEEARAKQARRLRTLRDKESDVHLALLQEVEDMDREELLNQLVRYEEAKCRSQAHNEILYSDDHGSDWKESGLGYFDLLTAIAQRMGEISILNEAVPKDESEKLIRFDKDPELVDLNEQQRKFENEVKERIDVLLLEHRKVLSAESDGELRELLMKTNMDVEASLVWYQEYRTNLLYYAVRYPDDNKKLYFDNPYEILELPSDILNVLFDAYDQLDKGLEAIKNSPSPLPS
jgi:hypothetical protein